MVEINKDKFDKIVNILVKYNAIEKKNKAKYEIPRFFLFHPFLY